MKLIIFTIIIIQYIQYIICFDFKQLEVTPDSYIINTVTTYRIFYDRTIDNNYINTAYASEAITSSDTITVTFPSQYTLTTITCLVQVDGGATNSQTCTISGNDVTVSGAFSTDTFVQNVNLFITNILNPSPAVITSSFTGAIGSDNAIPDIYSSFVQLLPDAFQSCSIVYNPSYVNSTGSMTITITTQNQIGSTGSIVVGFPDNRWTNDLSLTNYLPIASVMTCTNQSSNIKSSLQCSGDNVQNLITASSMFSSSIPSGTQLSYSIDDFLSPPTLQPVDSITITSFISGQQLDTCSTYVQSLIPNQITSISILSTTGTGLTVNQQYTIRFNLTTVDTLSQADSFRLTFPSNSILDFQSTAISSNTGVEQNSATYVNPVLNLYMNDIGRTFGAGSSIIFTVGIYTAPPSIQTTDPITIQVLNNGYSKMQGTVSITALQSTLNGSVSLLSTVVNVNTSYTFTITTLDALTSNGKIKISIPSTVTIDISSSACANVTGSNMYQYPTCTVNTTQNSITLSDINSTSSLIPIQTFSVTIQGLINPPSTAPTQSFSVTTYYQSTDSTLVATGQLNPINATVATIPSANVDVTASSYVVEQQSVTYSLQMTVVNGIPSGGYFYIKIPKDITMDVASASSHCSININSTSYVATDCSAVQDNSSYTVTFSNPFSQDAVSGTVFIIRISTIFTNPISTKPTASFQLYTFHSDGYSIAQIDSSLTIQMNTASTFNSISISRISNLNYDQTIYTFQINQPVPLQPSSILIITFPSDIVPSIDSVCSITLPTSQTLSCSLSTLTLQMILPNTQINSDTSIQITVTKVRNPPSFAPGGNFLIQTKTANNLYTYSYGISSVILSNNIPSQFQQVNFQFLPKTLDSQVSLRVTFDPSDSTMIPSSLWLTLANTFIFDSLSCNSFVDFTGSCTFSNYTVQVSGTFTSAPMSFSVSGIQTPTSQPVDYSTIITFDQNDYKIDQSTNDIIFQISCTLPCKTCSTNGTSVCTSCYENTAVTTFIYFDQDLYTCNQVCVDGKFEDNTIFRCSQCDSNCATCQNSATFCVTCVQSSAYYILYIESNTTQTCVSGCPSGMYPDQNIDPISCTDCVSPCATCSDVDTCQSCVSGTYFYNNSCLNDCPDDVTIQNPSNNMCDFCDPVCATCIGTITNCTSCAEDKLYYLNQCLNDCPSPLVPQNGTCGPCDDNCQTCEGNKYNCTSCDPSSSFAYLLNQNCLQVCPQLYYENIGSGICSLCSSIPQIHCQNCSTESTCLSCDSGYLLLNSTCLDYIPTGYVNTSGVAEPCSGDCATCDTIPSNCTSCQFFNLLNNQCLQNCPTGYIPLSKQCQLCQSPCQTCETTIDTCLSCVTTLVPDVFLIGNQCLQTCPDSTYANSATNTCDDCQSPCEYCTSLTVCTSCLNGFFLQGNSCPTSCQTGFTGVNRVCQACQGNCLTCENQTTLCITCVTGTYLFTLNNQCVTDCGQGLFIDALLVQCVSCQDPCKTCINSTTTCLSCYTGVLYNNNCQDNCPDKFFDLSGSCAACPTNCSSCTSLTLCTGCINDLLLYNDFCIQNCPSTHSVVINNQCTACSGDGCHSCTAADVCITCQSDKSLLNGACLTTCPAGYQTNGTHCQSTNQIVLTTSSCSSFPVPFSIAAAVFIIACLMSKLQFDHTYLAGAIYSLISILEWGALGYFLYLYFLELFLTQPLPFYIGLAALGYLYLLNIFALCFQNAVVCTDKQFKGWNYGCNSCFCIFSNFIAFLMNHKFRNILFCKLFAFPVFSAQLQSLQKFKVFNIFSFLSLLHSGAAIFAAATAIGYVQEPNCQLYYQCIDVIVCTAINIFFAFFNTMKPYDFFYQKTTDGFELKKKIVMDDEYIEQKISPAGNDQQEEQGYYSKISHVQGQNVAAGTHKAFKFNQVQAVNEQSQYSFGSLIEAKRYQDISIQALEIINDRSATKMFDISELQAKQQQNSNYTTIFDKTDKNIQNTIENQKTEKGVQRTIDQITNKSIQPSHHELVDQSIQGQNNKIAVDQSIQKTVINQNDQSMQYAPSMLSKKPTLKDQSVSMQKLSMKDQCIQQQKSVASKNIMYKPDVVDQSGQMSQISKYDQGIQKSLEVSDHSIQVQQQRSNKANQKSVSIGNYSVQMTKKSYVDESIQKLVSLKDQQVQIDQRVKYNQISDQMEPSKTEKVIFEQDQNDQEKEGQVLIAEQKDELIFPPEQMRDYKQQLQQRIRQKQKELGEIKRKIQIKQRKNNDKKEELSQKKKGNYIIEIGKLYNKGEKSESMEQKSTIKEQQNINQNKNQGLSQPLKKQIRHIQQEIDDQIDQTIQQIQVIDDLGEKRNIKYQYKENSESFRDSNKTQEEFIDMLKQQQQKIVFEDSQEQSDYNKLGIDSNSFKRNRPRVIQQYRSSQQMSQQKGDRSTKLNTQIRPNMSKINKINYERNQIIDYQQVDKSQNDESQQINSRPIQGRPYNVRSDMSDTIQEVYPHGNRTVGSLKIKEQYAKQKFKDMVNNNDRSKPYKKLPSQKTQKNVNKKMDNQYPNNVKNNKTHQRQSSLLLAGKSQFAQENLARKKTYKGNPLKTAKKWEFEHQDKNIQSGEQVPNTRFVNQKMLPTQTDKDQTQFKYSAVKMSQRDLGPRGHKVVPKPYNPNRQQNSYSQMSMQKVPTNNVPVKPKLQQYESQQQSNEYQPYIEDDDGDSDYASRYRNNMILDQMLERPDKDDLRNYYRPSQTGRRSQEKNKKSFSHLSNQTQKIYLQRLDKKWK